MGEEKIHIQQLKLFYEIEQKKNVHEHKNYLQDSVNNFPSLTIVLLGKTTSK